MSELLFPDKEHIPQWLANYFYKANAGNYDGKLDFYLNIKPIVLNNYADFIGYDLQIIEKKCHSCDGDGVYKKYDFNGHVYDRETCWSCNGTGIYEIKKMSLKRYLLNGRIYHIPAYEIRNEPVKNHINGLIKHEAISPYDAHNAYLILLWKYNRNWFYHRVKELIDQRKGELKTQLQNFVQGLIRKENINNELPF